MLKPLSFPAVESAADHYATLGVGAEADGAAIRSAYRNLMRRYHPDVNGSADAAARATAINEAYACLSNEEKRAAYDGERDRARRNSSSQRPFTSSPGAARMRRPQAQHSHWHQQRTFAPVPEPEPQPLSWKLASLGLAAIVTLATFAMTSAVPPPPPLPTQAEVTSVSTDPQGSPPRPSRSEQCAGPSEAPAGCAPPDK